MHEYAKEASSLLRPPLSSSSTRGPHSTHQVRTGKDDRGAVFWYHGAGPLTGRERSAFATQGQEGRTLFMRRGDSMLALEK